MPEIQEGQKCCRDNKKVQQGNRKCQQENYTVIAKDEKSRITYMIICLFTRASSHQAVELLCFGPFDEVCQLDGYSSL